MRVAIAGYGQEGEANYHYWNGLGAQVSIFDEKQPSRDTPEDAELYMGDDAFCKMHGFDLVIRTAGLNPNKIKTTSKVWSATNEFFAKSPAPIIGVTGTKGKGTTCSLVTAMLSAAGRTVHLVGNIGVSALEELPKIKAEDIVVFELSSFQLWDLEKSPETAVVLMIEPDHQDIHASMAEYIEAKGNIGRFQHSDDLLIYHPSNSYTAEIAAKSVAQKKRYQTPEGAYVSGGSILIDGNTICSSGEVGLIGPHNLDNICAAITAAWNYTQDLAAIKNAVIKFGGLEHRLEFVRELHGVKYFNDSFSSSPGATIAAIKSFSEPEVLICGGYDKQVDFNDLALAILEQKNIKKVVLIGQTKHHIADSLKSVGFSKFEITDSVDFRTIIKRAQALSESGEVVLLSPGCASFDMFKNFYSRGEQFKEYVGELQ